MCNLFGSCLLCFNWFNLVIVDPILEAIEAKGQVCLCVCMNWWYAKVEQSRDGQKIS